MIFYPKGYFKKVSDVSLEYLRQNGIKGLILDVDNTLIDYYKNMSEDTVKWANELKQAGMKMCILSNSNKKDKVQEVAKKLELEYSYFGMKPFKRGFKKAQKMLDLENGQIAVIGDQLFTDVIGANRMRMFSILVEPIEEKDILVTLIKRPIENYIKSKYLQQTQSENANTHLEPKSSLDENLTQKFTINHLLENKTDKTQSKEHEREEE